MFGLSNDYVNESVNGWTIGHLPSYTKEVPAGEKGPKFFEELLAILQTRNTLGNTSLRALTDEGLAIPSPGGGKQL